MNKEDLRYLLSTIENEYELDNLCNNIPLIKRILNEFVLDKKLVDKFNTIVENYWWCKNRNRHTIFDYIEYANRYNEHNEEVLKLNELNRKFYQYGVLNFDLDKDQKLELIDLIEDNEVAQNRLNQIIDNNLESTYDFDSLIACLKKKEKKNLLNI